MKNFMSAGHLGFKFLVPSSRHKVTPIISKSKQYSNTRSLLASTFCLPSEEVAISVANNNYNHYYLPFSYIMIIVIISDEDMLTLNKQFRQITCKQYFSYFLYSFYIL